MRNSAPHSLFALSFLAVVLLSLPRATAFEKEISPQSDGITIEGTVKNSAGEPIAAAIVFLADKDHGNLAEEKTKADGTFTLPVASAGAYTVRVQKPGLRDAVIDSITLITGEHKHLNLVLENLKASDIPPTPPSTSMELEDRPNFTIAGVTDGSAAGGHGSDASLRTSEALAKETLVLKAKEPDSAKKINLESPANAYDLALSYKARGDFARAREQVQKMLATEDKADLHCLLGDLDEKLGDPVAAVREYEQAARMDPSEQNYFEWGTELLIHKAVFPAIEVFKKGSALHGNSARMLAGLGSALYASGSYDDAAQRLCAASDLTPSDPNPYLFLGKMEKTAPGPLPCVEEKLAKFVHDQPGNALAHYYYAMTLWKQEKGSQNTAKLQQVEASLEKAAAIDPKLGEAYLQLGILYFARGDFEQAVKTYIKAIDTNPNLAEAHYRLALVHQRLGEQSKAQRESQIYRQLEKAEAAAIERQRQEIGQFMVVLKDQPAAPQ